MLFRSGNSVTRNEDYETGDTILWSQIEKYAGVDGTAGKASPKIDDRQNRFNLYDKWYRKNTLNKDWPNITLDNGNAGSKSWYNSKFENFDKGINGGNNTYNVTNKFSPNSGYTEYPTSPGFFKHQAAEEADKNRNELDKKDWRKSGKVSGYSFEIGRAHV